jgi:hypothetical protein
VRCPVWGVGLPDRVERNLFDREAAGQLDEPVNAPRVMPSSVGHGQRLYCLPSSPVQQLRSQCEGSSALLARPELGGAHVFEAQCILQHVQHVDDHHCRRRHALVTDVDRFSLRLAEEPFRIPSMLPVGEARPKPTRRFFISIRCHPYRMPGPGVPVSGRSGARL